MSKLQNVQAYVRIFNEAPMQAARCGEQKLLIWQIRQKIWEADWMSGEDTWEAGCTGKDTWDHQPPLSTSEGGIRQHQPLARESGGINLKWEIPVLSTPEEGIRWPKSDGLNPWRGTPPDYIPGEGHLFSKWHIRSVHSPNHMLSQSSHSNAFGACFIQSLKVWSSIVQDE